MPSNGPGLARQAAQNPAAPPHGPAQATGLFPQAALARTAAQSQATSPAPLSAAQIGSLLGAALLSFRQPSGMAGLPVPLRDKSSERSEARKHGKDHGQEYEAE